METKPARPNVGKRANVPNATREPERIIVPFQARMAFSPLTLSFYRLKHAYSMKIHQNNPNPSNHNSLMQSAFMARAMLVQTCGRKHVFHRYACNIPCLPGNRCRCLSTGHLRSTTGHPTDREHLGRALAKRMRFPNLADSVIFFPKSLLSDPLDNPGRNQHCECPHQLPKCESEQVPDAPGLDSNQ